MITKLCKTCKWCKNPKNTHFVTCSHEKRKWEFCGNERRASGNCGDTGKHWEAKK